MLRIINYQSGPSPKPKPQTRQIQCPIVTVPAIDSSASRASICRCRKYNFSVHVQGHRRATGGFSGEGLRCDHDNYPRRDDPKTVSKHEQVSAESFIRRNGVLTVYLLHRTSVLFVSISFIILMIISLVWLVFYYVQRFRYLQSKDKQSVSGVLVNYS